MEPGDWTRVYEAVFPDVYRALVATLMDREAALDAIHDAFEEGLRNPPPHAANIPGWIYRVAIRKARRARSPWPFFRPESRLEASADGGIKALFDRLETGRLLGTLTERQRSVVVAHYYLGLTQEDIATQLGVRRGTVSATISQALARLRGANADA